MDEKRQFRMCREADARLYETGQITWDSLKALLEGRANAITPGDLAAIREQLEGQRRVVEGT